MYPKSDLSPRIEAALLSKRGAFSISNVRLVSLVTSFEMYGCRLVRRSFLRAIATARHWCYLFLQRGDEMALSSRGGSESAPHISIAACLTEGTGRGRTWLFTIAISMVLTHKDRYTMTYICMYICSYFARKQSRFSGKTVEASEVLKAHLKKSEDLSLKLCLAQVGRRLVQSRGWR